MSEIQLSEDGHLAGTIRPDRSECLRQHRAASRLCWRYSYQKMAISPAPHIEIDSDPFDSTASLTAVPLRISLRCSPNISILYLSEPSRPDIAVLSVLTSVLSKVLLLLLSSSKIQDATILHRSTLAMGDIMLTSIQYLLPRTTCHRNLPTAKGILPSNTSSLGLRSSIRRRGC